MSRRGGWERLLHEHIDAARHAPFAWGEHDCALWASDWVQKCTGEEISPGWRGKYHSEFGAMRLVAERGHAGLAGVADAHLESIPVPAAKRGDVTQHPDGSLGVCAGRVSSFAGPRGLVEIETLACARAWRVG